MKIKTIAVCLSALTLGYSLPAQAGFLEALTKAAEVAATVQQIRQGNVPAAAPAPAPARAPAAPVTAYPWQDAGQNAPLPNALPAGMETLLSQQAAIVDLTHFYMSKNCPTLQQLQQSFQKAADAAPDQAMRAAGIPEQTKVITAAQANAVLGALDVSANLHLGAIAAAQMYRRCPIN